MRKRRMLAAVLLALCGLTPARAEWQNNIASGVVLAGQVGDYTTTRIAIAKGAHEANPLMKWPIEHEPAGAAIMGTMSYLQVRAIHMTMKPGVSTKSRVWTWVGVAGLSALKFYVIRNNVRVIEIRDRINAR